MNTYKWPVFAKLSIILIGLVALFYILHVGQDIIVPIVFSTIIAILLNPVVNFLCRKKVNRTFAILLSVVATILLIAGLAYFIITQASMFGQSLPLFKQKFSIIFNDCINWVATNLNVSKPKIETLITDAKADGMDNSSSMLGTALLGIGGTMILILLLPVYIFMILFYKPLLLEFIAQIFKNDNNEIVSEVLQQTKTLIQSYLIGLLIEIGIVATLNSAGLLILGIDYAILLGIIGALLNLIPYIGGLVGISLPMLIAIATKSPIYALWVLILYLIIQFIDNNFIVPKIVASKVKVNALVAIIVVLIGNALWGIAGMFLAIPIIAILKVVFDRLEPLKPFGFLISDNQPEIGASLFQKRKLFFGKTKIKEQE
nr:AI-2E family transporter [Bacteroidota bacterium]